MPNMTQVIRIKRSDVAGNTPSTLETGELAINTTDGLLFGRVNHSIVELNPSEMGGKLWETNTDYVVGDVVSYNNGLYIALADNDSKQPDVSPLWWYSFKTVFTDVGPFTPVSGGEYPDTTVVEPNAIWNIAGLGVNGYAMASGPFSGDTVKNDDKFIWQGYSAGGNNLWLLDKAPRLSLERGGIAYNSDINYSVGDIITEADVVYRCTTATTGNFVPADWQSLEVDEVGGKLWDPAINYDVGDIVGYVVGLVGSSYVCIQVSTGDDPTTSLSHWSDISEVEVGGRIYETTKSYLIGDIVTYANVVYRCITDNAGTWVTGEWEVVNTGSETFIGLSDTDNAYTAAGNIARVNSNIPPDGIELVSPADVGATINFHDLKNTPVAAATNGQTIVWDTSLTPDAWTYVTPVTAIGDLTDVSVPAPTDGNILTWNSAALPLPGQWEPGTQTAPEVGGIAYDPLTNYVIDDIVAAGQNIYIANAPSVGKTPGTDPEWTVLSLLEKGGLLYNNTLTYDNGDIVSEAGVIYAATGVVPAGAANGPPNPAYWATPTFNELGGRVWKAGNTYQIGDIVTDKADGLVYTATTVTSNQPTAVPADWQAVGGAEIGGKLYDTAINYIVGDVVSYSGGAYVCIAVTSGAWNPVDWKPTDQSFLSLTDTSNADYTGIAKYIARVAAGTPPDGVGIELVSPATIGATINLQDLKDITAPTVLNNSQMLVWNNTGSNWVYNTPKTSFIGLDDTVSTYTAIGDIARVDGSNTGIELVSPAIVGGTINLQDLKDTPTPVAALVDNGKRLTFLDDDGSGNPGYVLQTPVTDVDSLSNVSAPAPTQGDVLKWNGTATPTPQWESTIETPEVGGIFYRAATYYAVGDIITADDGTGTELYRCNTDYQSAATPGDFPNEVLNWTLLDTDPEKGGIAWEATVDYLKGDIVSDGDVIYLATVDILATPTVPGANSDWFFAQITEKGGVVWATGIAYAAGDIVTDSNGLLYSCNFGHISIVGDPVDGEPGVGTHWVSIGSERGGINWETDMEYYEGDVVTYIYPGDPPPASPPMVPVYEGVFVCNAWHISIVGDGTDGEPTVGGHWTPFVVNNLSSTSVTEALSANQGKILGARVGAAVVDAAAGTEVATINALLVSLRTAGLLLP